jgi:hypothetical protein
MVFTSSRALTAEGQRPADGFKATRRALAGWQHLGCSRSDILFHRRGRMGPLSTLTFLDGRFVEAAVARGSAFACVPRG